MKRAALLTLSVLLLAGCGEAHQQPQQAISAVLDSQYGKGWGFADFPFPRKPGHTPCVVHAGGPPPGANYPADCRTSVAASRNGSTIVRLRTIWTGPYVRPQRHVWKVRVSRDGHITSAHEFGDRGPWDQS